MNNKTINNKYEYTPELLQEKINEYFDFIEKNNKSRKKGNKLNIPCLAELYVDFLDIDKTTFYSYYHNNLFKNIIEKAKNKIEKFYLKHGLNRELDTNLTKFVLENHHNYSSKQEIKQDTTAINTNYNYDFSNKSDEEIKKLLEKANNGEDIDL